jgi:hypothetical protein
MIRRREHVFAIGGCIVGALVAYGSVRLSHAFSDGSGHESNVAAEATGDPAPSAGLSVDPAMVANANLTESLHQCSESLASLMGDKARLEDELEAERASEADASRSARARRIARRDPSQSDWKQLASTGTIRYVLPCAAFNPTPEVLDRLGLAQTDVPAIRSAFAAAREAAWAQIRPLCAIALGGPADRVGLDSCAQVILDEERKTAPADADSAMRAVGAVKAGLADPSAIPANDPVGAAFLVFTGIAKDAESQLASVLGPDDARAAVFGDGSCSRISEFTTLGPGSDL